MKAFVLGGLLASVAATIQAAMPELAGPAVATGIIATQVLLLWRVHKIEKEQSYQGRVAHWENNVLQQMAFQMDLEILPRPERTDG